MKVLFQNRQDSYQKIGGDTIQMDNTAKYLKKLGLEVDISLELTPDLKDYDLVHIFGIQRPQESLVQLLNAKKQGKKTVVSTIFWDMSEIFFEMWRFNWVTNQKLQIIKKIINSSSWLTKFVYQIKFNQANLERFNRQKEILKKADILLPNSRLEIEHLVNYFSQPDIESKSHVVPNAVDKKLLDYKIKGDLVRKYKLHNFVLEVGRIEQNKNQLNLIRALKGKGIQLVFVGAVAEKDYYNQCQKEADNWVVFLGPMSQHNLPELYRFAKVHVLPSFRETPGLASLEAGLFGCNLVSTSIGSAREYLGQNCYYCDPADLKSIEEATMKAFTRPHSNKLKKKILTEFTWEIAAQKTLNAYRRIQ